MLNTKLIEETVKIIVNYFEAEGIYEETSTIRSRVIDWYNHTDVTDSYMLAAAAMSGDYQLRLTYNELENLTHFYFPDLIEESDAYAEWMITH